METVLRFAAVYSAQMASAAIHYFVLRSGRSRMLAFVALASVVLLAPLGMPADQRILRFVLAVNAVAVIAKMQDLGEPKTCLPEPREFFRWLFNPTSFVHRKLHTEPSPPVNTLAKRIARGAIQAAIGVALLFVVWPAHLEHTSFWVEHAVKLAVFFAIVLGAIDMLVSFQRFFGKARDTMIAPYLASTPADFWRRYNRTVGQWFAENLFRRAGGFRHPVRATLLVFAFSALIHEYVFGIAIGAVQGWQTLFFMLQGVAVVATMRARPRGVTAIAGAAGTLAFNVSSGVMFFVSMHQLTPFWAESPIRYWVWRQ